MSQMTGTCAIPSVKHSKSRQTEASNPNWITTQDISKSWARTKTKYVASTTKQMKRRNTVSLSNPFPTKTNTFEKAIYNFIRHK